MEPAKLDFIAYGHRLPQLHDPSHTDASRKEAKEAHEAFTHLFNSDACWNRALTFIIDGGWGGHNTLA